MSPGAMHGTQLAIRVACGLKTDYEISLNWLGARCVVSAMAKKGRTIGQRHRAVSLADCGTCGSNVRAYVSRTCTCHGGRSIV